jgi:hypothetical protein
LRLLSLPKLSFLVQQSAEIPPQPRPNPQRACIPRGDISARKSLGGRGVVKQRLLLIAAAAGFLGCAPANAQMLAADILPPYEVVTIVRSMGLNPIERPHWRHGRYILAATDRAGRQVRVVVDAQSGHVIRVVPIEVGYYEGPRGSGVRPDPYDPRYGAPPPPPRSIPSQPDYNYGSQPGYGPRYQQPQPGYEDDDDYYDGRTGSIAPSSPQQMQPRITAPKVNTSPSARSAAVAPQKSPDATPLPRPKPTVTQSASKQVEPPPVPQGEIRKIEINRKPDPAPEAKAEEPKKEETKPADPPVVPLL